PKYAHQLFEQATARFVADPSPNLYDALILLGYLRLMPQPESDVALVDRFLGAAFDRIRRVREQMMADGTAPEGLRSAVYFSLNRLYPFYRVYWPERAGEVLALAQQLVPELRPQSIAAEELFPTEASRADVTGLIAHAESEQNEDNRDALYFQAALTLTKKGDYQRALDITARTRSGERHDAVLTFVHSALAAHQVATGELNDAVKTCELIKVPEERAEVTIQIAQAARKKQDLILARQVLDQAQKLFASQTGTVNSARAYLWLASTYSAVDPLTGFEMMAAAVKLANNAPDLDDYRAEPRLLSLGGAAPQAIYVGDSKSDFRAGFRPLARADFSRTLSIAESFNNELLRGISVIAAATSVLQEPSARQSSRK
ncbi:MAG TPA: hypothetical protein VE775_08640, partial [Pyrinomonadaceae bacterium]|nr:hypothetical protein [Pyrinomonadaceae bacterium]